jgi:hypothetical protein
VPYHFTDTADVTGEPGTSARTEEHR